jgi:hypothetical protein
MSRMIDRNKRDMQPMEGGGGGASMGMAKRGASRSMDDKVLDRSLIGLSAAKAAGAAGMAMGQEGRRDEAMKRDKAITRTEDMQRKAAKGRAGAEPKKYAQGGSVSKRADGIAQRGKTSCKVM